MGDFVLYFPKDVIRLIFLELDPTSLLNINMVSKAWNEWGNRVDLWKLAGAKKWNISISSKVFDRELPWKNVVSTSVLVDYDFDEMEVDVLREKSADKDIVVPGEFGPPANVFQGNPKGIIQSFLSSSVVVTASSVSKGSEIGFIQYDDKYNWTKNEKESYYLVDLGKSNRVIPHYYTLKYGSSGNYCCMRYWELRASNNMKDWDVICEHINDKSMIVDYAWNVYQVPEENTSQAYRYFQVIQTGKNYYYQLHGKETDEWSHVLVASGFDLFGLYLKTETNVKLVKRIRSKSKVLLDTIGNLFKKG